MLSTIGNSAIPSSGSTLVSTSADTPVSLSWYTTTSGATPITLLNGTFDQLVVLNQGTVGGYCSVDSGVTWHALPGGGIFPVVFRNIVMNNNSVLIARPQGGSNVTNISAWAH
jgi:3',5'-cyclic AMP phosphodiesterase CpdA